MTVCHAGKLKATLARHTGPVFALRWNRRGDLLLTSSADESTVVWDVATSSVRQQFSFQGGEADGCNALQRWLLLAAALRLAGLLLGVCRAPVAAALASLAHAWHHTRKCSEAQISAPLPPLLPPAVLDADWRNAQSFATCTSDNNIHLCKLGSDKPIKTWTGHTNEVRMRRRHCLCCHGALSPAPPPCRLQLVECCYPPFKHGHSAS